MHFIKAEKMPRKLKVGFSSSPANLTHATYRDLGFAAREDGNLMSTAPAAWETIPGLV